MDSPSRLAVLGWCSCCGRPVAGIQTAQYPARVVLDYHAHPRLAVFCIGSRSVMRRYTREDERYRA